MEKINWNEYLKRFKNPGTIMALICLIGSLLMQFGVKVDQQWLSATIQIICNILIILGVCNNPETNGLDTPGTKK